MKYQTHPTYEGIKYIQKHKLMELELPAETKEIISNLVGRICGDNDKKHACLLRAYYLRNFEYAAQEVCESEGESLYDDLFEPEGISCDLSVNGNVDVVAVFKNWMEREIRAGVDLEYVGCCFIDGLLMADKFKEHEEGLWEINNIHDENKEGGNNA